MQTFDDVLSQLVSLLRKSDAGGFVPRASKTRTPARLPDPADCTARQDAGSAGLVSYRDVYSCPASSWGNGGYVPEAAADGPAASAATDGPTACRSDGSGSRSGHSFDDRSRRLMPRPAPSVKMPFRIFDEA